MTCGSNFFKLLVIGKLNLDKNHTLVFLSFSPLQCSKIVVDLLRKTSNQYSKSKRSESFVVDLISLNTPKLLLDCESEVSASEFTDNLRSYIKIFKLRQSLVQKYIHIIVSIQSSFIIFMLFTLTGIYIS